jgi:hypothetical protein
MVVDGAFMRPDARNPAKDDVHEDVTQFPIGRQKMTGRMLKLMGASAAIAIVASAAQADTWRYATEEAAANDVQNVFAQ